MTVITLSSVWYSSQLSTIALSLKALLSSSNTFYILSYLFIILSLVISQYQSLTAEKYRNSSLASSTPINSSSNKEKQIKEKILDFIDTLGTLVEPAKSHPTTPYALLAIAHLIIIPKYKITLIPFIIFAFFHAINYTRTFILPILPISDTLKNKFKSTFEFINTKYHEKSFKFAVWIQLISFIMIFVWAIVTTPLNLVGYGDDNLILNWISVYIWYSFINVLQTQNLLMTSAINEIITALDGISADPRVPQNFKDMWIKVRQTIRPKVSNHEE